MGGNKQALINQNNSTEYRIYALVNEKDDNVFYIGITKRLLEARLASHISTAKTKKSQSDCYVHIRRLLSKRCKIYITELCYFSTCKREDALEIESDAIRKSDGLMNDNHNMRKKFSLKTIEALKKMGYK